MIGTALTGLFSAREGTHIDLVTPGFRVGETNQHRGVRLTGYHSPPPAPPAPDELQDLHREVPPRVALGRPAQTGIEPGEHVTLAEPGGAQRRVGVAEFQDLAESRRGLRIERSGGIAARVAGEARRDHR